MGRALNVNEARPRTDDRGGRGGRPVAEADDPAETGDRGGSRPAAAADRRRAGTDQDSLLI